MRLWPKKQNLFQVILMKKNVNSKTQNLYILFAFLLITIALLIAVDIYCYLVKYQAKQKYLLPFSVKNNELSFENLDSNNKLEEIDIKNSTYYYFDDIIKTEDFNLDNILIYEKSYEKHFSL